MQKNPNERLGARGIDEIINHPFFDGIDWEGVKRQETPLPLTQECEVFYPSYTTTTRSLSKNYFDAFSHYVDGTDRYKQKQQVKGILLAWLHSDLSHPTLSSLTPSCYGQVPYRGVNNGMTNGSANEYYRFMNKNDLIQHCSNEIALYPETINLLKTMTTRIEESSILFEGERCVCKWRAWG